MVEKAAQRILDELPEVMLSVVRSGKWAGGPVLALTDPIHWAVNVQDLHINQCFILPIIELYADRVPSAYFLADTVMHLDKLLNDGLLKNKLGQTKTTLALAEGGKLKNCCSYVRYLTRNTEDSHYAAVKRMTALVRPKSNSSGNSDDHAALQSSSMDEEGAMTLHDMADAHHDEEEAMTLYEMANMPDMLDGAIFQKTMTMLGIPIDDPPDHPVAEEPRDAERHTKDLEHDPDLYAKTCELLGIPEKTTAASAHKPGSCIPCPEEPACLQEVLAHLDQTDMPAVDTALQNKLAKGSEKKRKRKAAAHPAGHEKPGGEALLIKMLTDLGAPREMYPTGVTGAYSYTLRDPGMRGFPVEVHLNPTKPFIFFVRGITKEQGRNVNWAENGGIVPAWRVARERAKWV